MADTGGPRIAEVKGPVAPGTIVEIKAAIRHPMESGLRKDKESGEVVPAHYVEKVEAVYLDKPVARATWTGSVSKNPIFRFNLKATKTGKLKITWTDNKGGSWSQETEIKVQ
ncbi:MAG: thiosulfate oxidation carrier complex protein SoxZ [Magnetococcus sp. DMHC-1]|nr:thiosulfate oxidation carrier complex protein SoxZ [Magnetococcales bacterium]